MLGLRLNSLTGRKRRSVSSQSANVGGASSESLDAPSTTESAANTMATTDVHANGNHTETVTQQTKSNGIVRKSSFQITRVFETTRTLVRRIVGELDDVSEHHFTNITLESYLEYISDERLMHMPRKGSPWDRVLRAAEFFGVQIDQFGDLVRNFVPESQYAARSAIGSLQLLLELGHNQAEALNPTFSVLYDFGLLLAQTLHRRQLVGANDAIKEDVGEIFSSLVSLLGKVAIYYRQRINSLSTNQTGVIDFEGTFGQAIQHIWNTREQLSNHMWTYQLRNKQYSMTIEILRRRLRPVDESVKAVLYGRVAERAQRTEGTCEWVQSHLLDFLRSDKKTFAFTGASGHGKTVIAGWISERLQRPLGRMSYEAISYGFPSDTPSELRPVAFLKSIIFQLLERNVGDAHLYERTVAAFETYDKHRDEHKLDQALWSAVEAGLKTMNDENINVVFVIDGFDEVTGEVATALFKRLQECVEKFSHTRAITLSRPVSALGNVGSKYIITPDANRDDIAKFLHHELSHHQHFHSQDSGAKREFVHALATKAKGSFLYAFLAIKLLNFETSYESFHKLGGSMPADVHGILHKLVTHIDLKNHTTREMLAFMLVAQRPLTVGEMEDLLSIDVHKRQIHSVTNIRKHIKSHCRSLVFEKQGVIRFKHNDVKQFFAKEIAGHQIMSLQDANAEFTKRMLFYIKHTFTHNYEPSFDVIGRGVIHDTFHHHALVEYVVRHWTIHFRESTFYDNKGHLHLSNDFKDIFPDSTFFVMLLWACWQQQFTVAETRILHDLTLQIQIGCFGEKHRSVMQSLLIMGNFYRSSDVHKAAEFYYRATVVGRAVLYKFSAVIVTCTTTFLTITETITFTSRTTIVTQREELIRLMIEICKSKYGKSSDQVIKWHEALAKLYIAIKEEHRATEIYKELYEIIVVRYGEHSSRSKELRGTIAGFSVNVKGTENERDIVKYQGDIFQASGDVESIGDLRVEVIIRLALSYEKQHKYILAERLYINLWRRVSEMCRVKGSVEWHMVKIKVALEYVHFLQRVKRTEEASSILVALWAEYEHHSFEDESLIIRIREIGTVCKTFGLLTVAVSIFSKVWGWFKSHGKTEHAEAAATTVLITEVVEEIEETMITKKTTTTTTTTTTVTETVTREIFETNISRSKAGKADGHFFKAAISLITLLITQQKWSECETIIKRSLEIAWSAVLTETTKLTLTGHHVKEIITIATRLAMCYRRQGFFEKAEEIYLRIFRACIASFSIDHAYVTETSVTLIEFYEEYHRHEKVIEIYRELLEGYRKHLGAAHALTIKTLYALGQICLTLGRKDGYTYYIEIIKTLNKGKHCHKDAFAAAIIVSKYYYEEHLWTELREICSVLWETFVHHHHEFTFTEEMITTLYERYVYVLEHHVKVEYSVLYKLSVEYRQTVIKAFGASAAIVIAATIALAKICERSEEHWQESITLYEEVITKTKTTTTTTTTTVVEETIIQTVKKRLTTMYVTVVTKGKNTSSTTIERGITVAFELYESLRLQYGCWHEKTLVQLRELCILYQKQNTKESHTHIIRVLHGAVVEIITKVTTSMTLYTAAVSVAAIFVTCNMVKAGHDLLNQLRHLIILHDMPATKDLTINLGGKVSKISFVFLIAFEKRLTQKEVFSYSEVMADILMEAYLYEEYTRVVKSEKNFEVILEVSARLRSFWFTRHRKAECEVMDQKLFALFMSKYGSMIHVNETFVFIFYGALLSELGKDHNEINLGNITCVAAIAKVKALLEAGEFHNAHEVARCAFQFISGHKWFVTPQRIGYGYKLAEYMAGIDVRKPTDNKLRHAMLETSRTIVREVLAACRHAKIDLVTLNFKDLTGLVRLLGEQEYYEELELLLEQLWRSREVQKTWSPEIVLAIGKLLVHAHYAAGHQERALELCDTLCYNLRRSRGWLHPSALAVSRLLGELYTAQAQQRAAMGVYEEVLRELEEDGDNATVEPKKRAAHEFAELLQRSHQRLGGWDKQESRYTTLFNSLKRRFGLDLPPIEQWSSKGTADSIGVYKTPTEWRLDGAETAQAVKATRGSIRRAAVRRSWYASLADKLTGIAYETEVEG